MKNGDLWRSLILPLAALSILSSSAAGAQAAEEAAAKGSEAAAAPAEAASEAATAEAAGTKVLVLPLTAIYRSVPQKRLDQATSLIEKELDNREELTVVRAAVSTDESDGPSLEEAFAKAKEAKIAEGERRIPQAIRAWVAAIAAYELNASAIEDPSDYFLAHHYLARAHMMSGDDAKTRQWMEVAAQLAPAFEPPPSEFSRLYRRWFAQQAKDAIRQRAGTILVNSVLPGAQVSLDGRPMDTAPVRLKNVPPGKHLVRAAIDGVNAFGRVVKVASGKQLDVMAEFKNTLGGKWVGNVTDALSKNELSKDALTSAATAGKDAGADFVVFGAMAKADDRYAVHTFVLPVKVGKVRAVDVVSFDLDMLTAESDVLKVVQGAAGHIENFSGGESAIKRLARLSPQSTINEQDASPKLKAPKQVKKKRGKKGPREVFRQLGGGTIEIKDEAP